MTNLLIESSAQRPSPLCLEAPHLASSGWIPPDTGWSLDDLRADHERLVSQIGETDGEVNAVRKRFAQEDAGYQDAVRQGFRDGVEVEAPKLTPPEERQAAISATEQNHRLACEALDDFQRQTAIPQIEAGATEWLGELQDVHEQARLKREEAARLLAEATHEVQRVGRLEEWIKRNAGIHERGMFRVTATKYVSWGFICENFNPQAPVDPDAAATLVPPLDEDKFVENLNRGVARPMPQTEKPLTELQAMERAAGVEPVDQSAAETRQAALQRVADGVDDRAWNPGNSQEAQS